jgi:hypothetical protein
MDLTQNKKTPSFEGDGVSAGVEIKSVITPQDFLPGRSSDWARLRFAKLERGFELVVGRMVGVNSAKGRPPSFEGGWREGRAPSSGLYQLPLILTRRGILESAGI